MTYSPVGGKSSSLNSTTTPLASGATFTGGWENIVNFGSISINASADVAGTLWADFSPDGITAQRNVQLSNGADGAFGIHSLIPVNSFFRVRLVNGDIAQSSMTIESLCFRGSRIAQPTSRLGQSIQQFSDVLNTRVSNDVNLDTARGAIGERTSVQKFGRNPIVGTSAQEDIWEAGGDYNFLQAPDNLRIRSGGSPQDIAGTGIGARAIVVIGLDSDWNETTAVIATSGAGVSASTPQSFIRMTRAYVSGVGVYGGFNTNNILIETNGGTLVGEIDAGEGQTELAITSIPAGKTAFVTRIRIFVGGTNKTASVFMIKREKADVVSAPFGASRIIGFFDEIAGGTEDTINYSSLIPIPEKSDLWFRGIAQTSAAAIDVSFDYILVDNPNGS
jgi:hypothetical protein